MKLSLLPLHNDKVVRLACEGEICRLGSSDEEPLRTLLGPSCYGLRLLIDMEQAKGIDTSGIGWLLNLSAKVAQAGGKLVLHGVPPMISQVLDFVQAADLVFVAADESSARALALADHPGDGRAFGNHSRPLEEIKKR